MSKEKIQRLLKLRRQIKRRKPNFVMQDAHKKIELKQHWRRPRGIDSKIRLHLKGYNKRLEVGYGSPRLVRGLDRSGLMPINVSSVSDIEKLNKDIQGAIIGSTVGNKKRIEIINKAKSLNVQILNIRQPEKCVEKITDELKKRKEARKAKKEKAKKKEEKKIEKKDDLAEKVLSAEEKAEADKKEKDKLLTKKT